MHLCDRQHLTALSGNAGRSPGPQRSAGRWNTVKKVNPASARLCYSRPAPCTAVPDHDWVPHVPVIDSSSAALAQDAAAEAADRQRTDDVARADHAAAVPSPDSKQQAHRLPQAASVAQMPKSAAAAVAAAAQPSLGPTALIFMLGAATASLCQSLVRSLGMPVVPTDAAYARHVPPDPFGPDVPPLPPQQEPEASERKESILPDSESVEWVNMCIRKIWRVYQRGLENWISALLQPVFDTYINEDTPPTILKRIRIARFTLNHEPPLIDNMQRRNSRKESDLNAVCSVRYSGGAKMLLVLELGGRLSGVEVPVMVEEFDLDARMWIKLRLAPMCPWIGVISVAFVEQPRIQVQLNTYGMLPLMRIPVLQRFLRRLLTVELPGIMVLPQRLEINLPPSVTALAEAAVGRDTVMRAVASAVLQADAMEQALYHALPMDAANVASAVTVPEAFVGELTITLVEGRNLPVWGFPWQSNPYCRIVIGTQAMDSKRERETGSRGSFRCPNWNQEFQFLVEDSPKQTVKITVYDSPYTGRVEVGVSRLRLDDLPKDGTAHTWLPVLTAPTYTEMQGELFVRASYRAFDEVEGEDSGAWIAQEQPSEHSITDVQSAAEASARAAVEASQGLEALAVAKAAAARAAARLRGRKRDSETEAASASDESEGLSEWPPAPPSSMLASLDTDSRYAEQLVRAVREQQAAALATELSQRAVARVTDKSTSPAEQATLKKRVDGKMGSRDGVARPEGVGLGVDEPAVALAPRLTPDAAQAAEEPASAAALPAEVLHKRTNVDFDLVAEGDGTTTSMSDVKSTHIPRTAEEDRGRATPLLPGGLPGPGGRALDELMVREATARVRSVDTEDLAVIQSPPNKVGAGQNVPPDSKRVVVADGKGRVINPELSIQSDSAIMSDDLERIVDALPRGVAALDKNAPSPDVDRGEVAVERQNGAGSEERAVAPAVGSNSAAVSEGELVGGEDESLTKTIDLAEEGQSQAAAACAQGNGKPVEEPAKQGNSEGADRDNSRPWWRFGWGVEDSFMDPQPEQEPEEARQDEEKQDEQEKDDSRENHETHGEFWGWAQGMSALVGLRHRDPQQASEESRATSGDSTDDEDEQSKGMADEEDKPWWDGLAGVFRRAEKEEPSGESDAQAGKDEDRALSTVIVSPDVPIEEIAAEIARVKVQQSQRSDEKNRQEGEDMLKGPLGQLQRLSDHVVRLDKPEIVLLCGLSGGVLVLLAVVAYRIELYMDLIRALDAWR